MEQKSKKKEQAKNRRNVNVGNITQHKSKTKKHPLLQATGSQDMRLYFPPLDKIRRTSMDEIENKQKGQDLGKEEQECDVDSDDVNYEDSN